MRNRNFFYAVIVAFLPGACGSDSSKPDNIDSLAAVDTTGSVSPVLAEGPLSLTAAELKDDPVFSDGSVPTSWSNAGIKDSVNAKKFIRQLQVWVAGSRPDSIAPHLDYPLKNPAIADQAAFVKNYPLYFNDAVKSALMSQNLSQVFRNQQGVMIGGGRLWLTEKNNNMLIIAINN